MAQHNQPADTLKTGTSKLESLLQAQLGLLTVQFLAGMALNLIGTPSSNIAKIGTNLILLLHVAIAVGLVAVAIRIGMATAGSGIDTKLARFAGGAIGLAVLGGLLTMATPLTNVWSYVMSIGFIAAIGLYGRLYGLVLSQPQR
jgi:hypothetical protein